MHDNLLLADANVRKKAEKDSSLKGMGSTAVAVIIKGSTAYYAHVGDSRMYLFRNKKGNQLIQNAIDSLVIQSKNIELAASVLNINNLQIEGSESLDNPNAVFN